MAQNPWDFQNKNLYMIEYSYGSIQIVIKTFYSAVMTKVIFYHNKKRNIEIKMTMAIIENPTKTRQ